VLRNVGERNEAFVNEMLLDVVVKFLVLLLRFVEVPSSDVSSEIGYA
jgi:hypothetical protein